MALVVIELFWPSGLTVSDQSEHWEQSRSSEKLLPIVFNAVKSINCSNKHPPQPTQNQVNNEISRTHNLNGIGSLPPFIEDHTSGTPQYFNPWKPQMVNCKARRFRLEVFRSNSLSWTM
ncbi:predicted protein [Histoplasma capsulatum var. duboisii H88]|uniref:Predicted protein n=1 Tax=Ajellomyces capsulatus (strain H88) TaxID=544711 RepID=F0U7R3_AJEC8|nr:predicted protein [Histoplasma capsulatum var. duboisii H88]